jgi:hypothetical protein
MMKALSKSVFVALALCAIGAAGSSAGIIVDPPAPIASGPGLGFAAVPAVVTLNPNNDNQTGATPTVDNNIIVPLKRFDSNNYIDIVFTVADSQGVTEYQVTEFVDNNTGVPWIGYQMQLGFGVGAGFTLATPADGLDFDAPLYDSPPVAAPFPVVSAPDPATLIFSGGIQNAGAQLYQLRIDVPDLGERLPPNVGTFTLRQMPIPIPEPSTAALAALAGLALALRRR